MLRRAQVIAIGLAFPLGASAADTKPFLFDTAIYIDAKEGQLRAPEGVACTENGYIVVADTGNQRLLTYTFKDDRLTGGTELKPPEVRSPVRVQVDSKGNVLVLDSRTRRVARLASSGAFDSWVDPKDVKGPVAVSAFKLDAADGIYLLDVAGKRILVVDAAGKVSRELPVPAEAGPVTDIAVDGAGIVYAIDPVQAVLWSADKGAAALKPMTKSLKDVMSFPAYLSIGRGRILVVDQNGSGIVFLGLDGSYQGRQLGIGWSDGLVNYPAQICQREDGVLIVADRFNNRVQLFSTRK
jgi:hypothetical protein